MNTQQHTRAIILGMDSTFLPIVRRFAAEGILPNFSRLMAEGTANEAMPCLPCYTPTNWATLATGAWPGTHGAANWNDRRPGDQLERTPLSTFDSRTITAETIWEAAERAGLKCLVVAHPAGWPPRIRQGYVLAPLDRGLTSFVIRSGEVVRLHRPSHRDARSSEGRWTVELHVPGSEHPEEVAAETTRPSTQPQRTADVRAVEDGAELAAGAARRGGRPAARSAAPGLRLSVTVDGGGERATVTLRTLQGEGEECQLQPGQWSGWYFGRFAGRKDEVRASCRFKLVEVSGDGSEVRLIRSEVYPTEGISYPDGLGEEVIREVGPYLEHPAVRQLQTAADVETVMEEVRYQALWHARVARYLYERDQGCGERPWDLYQAHWHWPDTAIHGFLAGYDPASPVFDPERAAFATDILRRTYQIADEMLGAFLDLADAHTYVLVVSDHGNSPNRWAASPLQRLQECGLLAMEGDHSDGPRRGSVDWARSRAYAHGGLQFCVNLKGREPSGCVEPADYEQVQEEIIDALYSWKDPATGRRPIALALKKRDAQLLGFWGDTVGDVIFLYNSGFAWTAPESGSVGVARGGANHGPQPPTARTDLSSNLGVIFALGPGIKRGYERDRERLGLMRLVDVVPTVCHLLGIQPPAQSQGSVLYDILET